MFDGGVGVGIGAVAGLLSFLRFLKMNATFFFDFVVALPALVDLVLSGEEGGGGGGGGTG